MQFRNLQRQYEQLKKQIDAAISDTLVSSQFIMGQPVKQLEEELAAYVGARYCLTCGNGTDALTLALKAIGVKSGDAVFVPDFTFFASAEVVAAEGATPVFVDVCYDTFNISVESLKSAIDAVRREGRLTPKAIIAVDLFGQPADFVTLRQVADDNNLMLVEDGAQGFGGSIGERRACSFGDISTTSFFPAKPLGCYGDGGAVFTNNADYAALIESLRVHGKGTDKYDNVRIGLNSRLDTLQAAVLRVKLNAFAEYELDDANTVANSYGRMLPSNPLYALPTVAQPLRSSWAQYTLRLDPSVHRAKLQADMKAAGVPTMVYYPTTMSSQTAFAGLTQYVETPVAHKLSRTVLSLPFSPYLSDAEQTQVVSAFTNSMP